MWDMRPKVYIFFLLFSIGGINSYATEQISDLLIYEEDSFHLYYNILSAILPEDPSWWLNILSAVNQLPNDKLCQRLS